MNVVDLVNVDPSTSVLFVGSGFSLGGKNLYGQTPPNGSGLRRHMIETLRLPPDTQYDLQVLAEEFAADDEDRLYDELYNLFHITDPGAAQTKLLKEKWLRVYTTNYDNLIEVAQRANRHSTFAYTTEDNLPNKLAPNSIVHLHGSIDRLRNANVLDQIVLGETSYVRQYLSKSPWYTQFQHDIRFATNLFIVGYSLSDYHISALLLESPEIAERTYFIQPPCQDPRDERIFVRRTKSYGQTLFIGTEGFADLLSHLPRVEPALDPKRLKSFRLLDPQKDRKGLKAPTAPEVMDLLTFGTFNYTRAAATVPAPSYVIPRVKTVQEIVDGLTNGRAVIVDGRLGNGKTITLHLAFLELAQKGYVTFLFRAGGPSLEQELRALEGFKKLLILFDDYAASQDSMARIAAALPNAKFIVEIRTGILEVRYHEVREAVPQPYRRVSLNRLTETDFDDFISLCSRAGLPTRQLLARRGSAELRDLLLLLLGSPVIRDRIDHSIRPIFESPSRRSVLLLTTLLGKFHLSADPGFIRSVTGVDPYHEFRPQKEVADELFEADADVFRVRSSVFSEFAVNHMLKGNEIVDCLIEATRAAAARKTDRTYRVLMSNLMQYSNIDELFRGQADRRHQILSVYERLRWDQRINDEPLFWLQYAIAMAASEQLTAAEQFIRTSYERAADRTGFKTFQIDTQALRIILMIETEAPSGTPVSRIEEIIERLEKFNDMLGEESHRSYAVRVLEGVPDFVTSRHADLSQPERVALVFWINRLCDTLARLPPEFRARTGSDNTMKRLANAKAFLI